jgi:hypothetical protein
MNYTELQDKIISFCKRPNDPLFIAQVPFFITCGMLRIYTKAKTSGTSQKETENAAPLSLSANQPDVALRLLWKQTLSIFYQDGNNLVPLEEKSPEYALTYWPQAANATGKPRFYSLVPSPLADANYNQMGLYITPTPDQNYNIVHSFLGLPLFNLANPNNYYANLYPGASYYSCLVEATLWLGDPRFPDVKQLYDEGAAMIGVDTLDSYDDRTDKRNKA